MYICIRSHLFPHQTIRYPLSCRSTSIGHFYRVHLGHTRHQNDRQFLQSFLWLTWNSHEPSFLLALLLWMQLNLLASYCFCSRLLWWILWYWPDWSRVPGSPAARTIVCSKLSLRRHDSSGCWWSIPYFQSSMRSRIVSVFCRLDRQFLLTCLRID